MKSLCRLLLALLAVGFAVGARAEDAPTTVFLIQNSGWMEPFYSDRKVQFKPLLNAFIGATQPRGEVVIAAFNQDGQLPGHRSPEALFRGSFDAARVAAAIDAMQPPVRPDGHLTDADFNGALDGALHSLLGDKSGVIFMVTNNKNSPNNSQEVNANTRSFANKLSSAGELPYVVAYPLRADAKGRTGSEKGLIIYGIAIGKEGEAALRRAVNTKQMRALFADPAAELKSTENVPLVFLPKYTETAGISVALQDDNSLYLDGVPEAGSTILIVGDLRSDYFPLMIERADASVRWVTTDPNPALDGITSTLTPNKIFKLAPQTVAPNLSLSVTIPKAKRPGGLAGLMMTDQLVAGYLQVDLSNVGLSMQESFARKLNTIAALDQLPDVFFDYKKVTATKTVIPVLIRVHYSRWPLIGAIALIFLLALLAIAVAMVVTRVRSDRVSIGGKSQLVHLKAFQSKSFPLPNGGEVVVTGTLFGPFKVQKIEPAKEDAGKRPGAPTRRH